ncbi:MAG: hypothetical protein QGG48_14205, partial [Desulfatiglandales bacterium]|nr:hypothetical protein [Desulfatiglandales bacterium]
RSGHPFVSPYICMCPSIVHSHDRNGLGQLVSITERSFLEQERRPCLGFGTKGSEVQIFSSRPLKTMGYGLGRSPFFIMFTRMFTKRRQNAVTPLPSWQNTTNRTGIALMGGATYL